MECIKQHVARVCSMLDAQVTVSAAGKAACHVPLHVSSSQKWGGSEQERVLATLQSLCAEQAQAALPDAELLALLQGARQVVLSAM